MDFYKRVQYVSSQIPWGCAASYGQIALLCGFPDHARQVGCALRTGRAGEGVPAHRIVNSQGYLTGASSFSYPEEQKILLEAEGISVCSAPKGWKIDMDRCRWRPALSEAESFRRYFAAQRI